MYKKGGFIADMSKDLPQGYKIEKPDRDNSTYVAVNITNGNENQSARLKFQISEVNALKKASQNKQTQSSIKPPAATAKIKKIGGKIVQGKTTYWYHPGGKLAGMIDTLPNGKQKIMDAKGQTLYYVLDKTDNDYITNGDITYYDKNNKPKYCLQYYGSDVHYNLHVLDKDGNSIKKYNMNIDYEERDGFDIDFTGPDDYAKDDNERYINTTFGKLQDYNNKLNGPYYSPVSCF